MTAYISHSQQDVAHFSAVQLALEGQGIRCWNPRSMEAGKSLKTELQSAIQECAVCVFIATKNSVASRWCAAELGAFWGIGKRVVVLIYEEGVTEDSLPPQLRGDLWTNDVGQVIRVARLEIDGHKKLREKEAQRFQSQRLADLSIADFTNLLLWMRSSPGTSPIDDVLSRVLSSLPTRVGQMSLTDRAGVEAVAGSVLGQLVGAPEGIVLSTATRMFPNRFSLETDSGTWSGFSRQHTLSSAAEMWGNCLLLRFSKQACDGACLVSSVWEHETQGIGLEDVFFRVGRGSLGRPKRVAAALS